MRQYLKPSYTRWSFPTNSRRSRQFHVNPGSLREAAVVAPLVRALSSLAWNHSSPDAHQPRFSLLQHRFPLAKHAITSESVERRDAPKPKAQLHALELSDRSTLILAVTTMLPLLPLS